ncbi:DUF3108 domain-containing protein [Arenimonas alkanexedens]
MRLPYFVPALLAALMLPGLAWAAPPPAAFAADYQVQQDGKPLGTGRITLRRLPNGRWEMSTRSEATEGLFAVAGVRRKEVSVMDWTGDTPRTLDYDMQQDAAWSKRRETLAVDPRAGTARVTYKGEAQSLPYRDGLLDRHAVTAALMSELSAGRRGEMSFAVAGRRNVEVQRYRTAANVRLRTALGVERAIRVERVRDDDSGRITKIWFARNRGWLPLRIKQYESDGSTLDMRITAVR